MIIPNLNLTEESEIRQLVEKSPGTALGLSSAGIVIFPPAYYKKDKLEFYNKIKEHLNSKLAGNGVYNVLGGTNIGKTRTIFTIQKGNQEQGQKIEYVMPTESTDIQLVKENAELKAELAYLKLRLEELTAQLEEQEADLAEGEEAKEESKPNPWANLAEQLIPVAGQIAAAIATKYLTPDNHGQRTTSERPMAPGYPGGNAATVTSPIQYRWPNNSGHLQGNDYSRPDVRDYNSEPQPEE
jgi:hypothetical protein